MATKLVRDLISKLSSANIHNTFTICENDLQYIHFLSNKLFEECKEFEESNHLSIEELADIMEVIKAFAEFNGYTLELLEQKRKNKEEDRGAFKERMLMITLDKTE